MQLNKKYLPPLVCLLTFSAHAPTYAADIATVTEIAEQAEQISGIANTVVDAGDITDVSSLAEAAGIDTSVIFKEPINYISGATTGMGEFVAELRGIATNSLLATADAVGLSDSASELLSGNGNQSGQAEPLSIVDDILTSNVVDNVEFDDCVKYKFIGLCFWVKTSFPWGFGSNAAAQNYVEDLQVEVTRRVPVEGTGIFDEVDNAPTDLFSGGILQNVGAGFGRIMDSLYSTSSAPDLQYKENQSAITNTSNPNQFLEAMVIGNPTLSLSVNLWASLPGYCKSTTQSYKPYFVSSLDVYSWRVLATTDALLLALYTAQYASWNQIGTDMGSVFPRMGYSESPDELNATVTASYRALSIVNDLRPQFSGVAGLHVGTQTQAYASGSLSNKSDMKYRTVRDHTSQRLRMTFPNEEQTCTTYTGLSKTALISENQDFVEKNKYGSASFKVYTPFVCCKRKHSYLYTVQVLSPDFERY